MLKRNLAKVLVAFLLFSTIIPVFNFNSLAIADYAFEIVSENTVTGTGADYGTIEYMQTVPAPTILNPKGLFLRIDANGNAGQDEFSILYDGANVFASNAKRFGYDAGNTYAKIFVADNGTVTTNVMPANFKGYVFIPSSVGITNTDLNFTLNKIGISMFPYIVNWNDKVSTMMISKAGYYSVSSYENMDNYKKIITELSSSYKFEIISENTVTGAGADYGTIDYMASVPAPTISNPKGVFLRIDVAGNAGQDEFSILYNGANVFASDAKRFGYDAGNTYAKIFIADDGTVTKQVMPANFKGYVFIPASVGTTNANMNFTVNKIGISMFPYEVNWNDKVSTMTISKAGYYSVSSYGDMNNYKNIIANMARNFDYQVISDNVVTGSGADYGTIDYMASVPAPTISNPKGVFLRIDVAGNAGQDEFSILYNGANVFASDAKRFGYDAGNTYAKIFIADDGTVTKQVMPVNFKGYVFVPAGKGTTNADLDFILNKIGISMFPYVVNWNDKGSTITISKAGYYFVPTYGDIKNYQDIISKMNDIGVVETSFEMNSTKTLNFYGAANATTYFVNPIKPVTLANPKGVYFKIDVSNSTDKLDFSVELNDEAYPNANAYEIGNATNQEKKVYIATDGTVTRGFMPKNFKGYVFVPQDFATNANIPFEKIKAMGIYMGEWGALTWTGASATATNFGFYSVSKYSGDAQYTELVKKIEAYIPINYSYQMTSNATNNISGVDGQITYLKGVVEKPTIENPKGVFIKLSTKNATNVLDFTITMGKELSTQPNTDPKNYLDFSNAAQRICVAEDGTVTRGYIPINFSGYVFVPVSPSDNGNLPIDKIYNFGFWRHNWTGKGSWAGVEAVAEKSGYYSVSKYDGDVQYKDLVAKIEEETKVTGDATYSFEVVNDYETKDARDKLRITAGNGDMGGGFVGSQALSGNGSAVVLMNNYDWALDNLVYPTRKPSIKDPKGIFFRLKTDAKKGSDFMVSLGEFAPGYEIGNGAPRKVYVSIDGKVSQGTNLPSDNFDGYVFIPEDPDLNANLKINEIYSIGVWFNHWQMGVDYAWFGKTTIFDNVGFYSVSRYSGIEQYAKMVKDLNKKYGNNTTKDMYFTTELSPIPYDKLNGTQTIKPLICLNLRDSIVKKDVSWSVLEGKGTITTNAVINPKKQTAFIKFNGSGKVIIRATLKSNSKQFADITFDVAVDTTALEDLLDEANGIENMYSDSDWATFRAVVDKAEALMMKDNITEAEAANMIKKLEAAIAKILASNVRNEYIEVIKMPSEFVPSTVYSEISLATIKVIIKNTSGEIIRVKLSKPVMISNEILAELKRANKAVRFEIIKSTGDIKLIWEFATIDNADMDLYLEINKTSPNIKAITTLIDNNKKTQVISFRHSGILPGKAKIIIENQRALKAEDKIRLLYFNKETGALEAQSSQVGISNDGKYLAFTIDHCSDYLASAFRESKTIITKTDVNFVLIGLISGGVLILGGAGFIIYRVKRRKGKII